MKISISPGQLARQLFVVIIGLSLVSLSLGILRDLTGHGRLLGFGRMFNVAAESNIPTWYSSSALLLCAALLGLIAGRMKAERDRFARHWRILALAVLYLSADEACAIHETVGDAMIQLHAPSSLMHLGWVMPAAILAGLFVLAYVPFLADLPIDTRRLFLAAGIVYVSGAFGLEAVGGLWRTAFGESNISYTLMATTEEFLEMAGVAILAYSLTRHMNIHMLGTAVPTGDKSEPLPVAGSINADLSTAA